MKVKVSIPSVTDIELRVLSTATIDLIRKKACRQLGIEADLTSILHDGKLLDGNRKVKALRLGHKPLILDYLWARHLILWGQEGQKRLRNANVLIAGAGAIGNEVAKNLAMLGVRRLLIIDNDVVELSNTSRMIFFDRRDQGLNKALALAQNITNKFPYVEAMAWTGSLENLPLDHLLTTDVIVCGLDNVLSRIYLSQVSRKYSIPMVDGGIVGYQGRVQVYAPPEMPCPLCAFPSGEYGRIAGLRNPCDGPAEETKIPSLPTTISLVSSIQCQEVTKLVMGYSRFLQERAWPKETGEPLKGVLMIDLRHNRYSLMELKRNTNCIVCGKNGVAHTQVPRLEIPVERLNNSTTRLHEIVSGRMKLIDQPLRLFSHRGSKTFMVERGKSLRNARLRANSILTAIAEDKAEIKEAVVRLSKE